MVEDRTRGQYEIAAVFSAMLALKNWFQGITRLGSSGRL